MPKRISEGVYEKTEPHRRACEARHCHTWMSPAQFDEYLGEVREARGVEAADALLNDVLALRRV
jgi:hypothetical protein